MNVKLSVFSVGHTFVLKYPVKVTFHWAGSLNVALFSQIQCLSVFGNNLSLKSGDTDSYKLGQFTGEMLLL